MESILTSIKKMLGIAEEYKQFDGDIILHINSVFTTLTQLGVGPSEGFYIENETVEWTDFIPEPNKLQAVKSYMFMKVKLLFDPGSVGSSTLAAYERMIQEYEWRLNVDAESSGTSQNGSIGVQNDILLRDKASGVTHKIYVENKQLKMSDEGV
jgi:hypothetical protein